MVRSDKYGNMLREASDRNGSILFKLFFHKLGIRILGEGYRVSRNFSVYV